MAPKQITKEEFIEQWASRSGITREEFDRYFYADVCDAMDADGDGRCDYPGCEGWVALSKGVGRPDGQAQ